jgi:hypothetical protein
VITPEGDYLSNLTIVDCLSSFHHLHVRTMGHSMGHLVPSDWADRAADDPVFGLYKNCGCWTTDERSILGACMGRLPMQSVVVDIGCHTGLTSKTINWVTNAPVICVDPMLRVPEFRGRFFENTGFPGGWVFAGTSKEYFAHLQEGNPRQCIYQGFVIDGDHEPGAPLQDAQNAYKHLADTGVVLFHDFIGKPVRDAVTWLMDQGFKARVYWTPHLVAVCWRGDFEPPKHEPDPRINWTPHMFQMKRDFDFGRLS